MGLMSQEQVLIDSQEAQLQLQRRHDIQMETFTEQLETFTEQTDRRSSIHRENTQSRNDIVNEALAVLRNSSSQESVLASPAVEEANVEAEEGSHDDHDDSNDVADSGDEDSGDEDCVCRCFFLRRCFSKSNSAKASTESNTWFSFSL